MTKLSFNSGNNDEIETKMVEQPESDDEKVVNGVSSVVCYNTGRSRDKKKCNFSFFSFFICLEEMKMSG